MLPNHLHHPPRKQHPGVSSLEDWIKHISVKVWSKKNSKVTMKIHSIYLDRIASWCKPLSHQVISMQQIPWYHSGHPGHPRLWQQNLSLLRSFCKSVGEAQGQQTHLRRHGLWRDERTVGETILNSHRRDERIVGKTKSDVFQYQGKGIIRLHCSRKGW